MNKCTRRLACDCTTAETSIEANLQFRTCKMKVSVTEALLLQLLGCSFVHDVLDCENDVWIFFVCVPSLVGAYCLHIPNARTVVLHIDLQYTSSSFLYNSYLVTPILLRVLMTFLFSYFNDVMIYVYKCLFQLRPIFLGGIGVYFFPRRNA